MNKPGQPPDGFAYRKLLLRKNNYPGMCAAFGEPLRMQWNKIANVVRQQNPTALMRRFQLRVVVHTGQSKLICGFCLNAMLVERGDQGMSLAILVQMDSDSIHRLLRCGLMCCRGCLSPGQAVFALNFPGDFLEIR